ncbi:hypothetical protein GJ744_007522 [Endocarpon pusillum]|uniref:Protein kinase domain-containing protein n=1 Tax=Endocarpon pusillum TaxID=364733 RepID=A0A8H7E7E8_9EURO|nr:hypothetical protein GJ744_007522 [Endocarpon pusillum]
MHPSRILNQSLPPSAFRVMKGASGRVYRPLQALQPHRDSKQTVIHARSEDRSWVLKRFPNHVCYDHAHHVNRQLAGCQKIRLVKDKIPKEDTFVYDYFTTDLKQLMDRVEDRKMRLTAAEGYRILHHIAYGLKELHDRGYMHTNIKPDNVVVDYKVDYDGCVEISKVKITDEHKIVYLEGKKDFNPKGSAGPLLVGDEFWRSPEQQVGFGIGQAADCIKMNPRFMIFEIHPDDRVPDVDLRWQVLERMFKFFGPAPPAFFDHIGFDSLDKEGQGHLLRLDHPEQRNQREQFWDWVNTGHAETDELIFSFLRKMLTLDPGRRATIDKVLDDPWWDWVN